MTPATPPDAERLTLTEVARRARALHATLSGLPLAIDDAACAVRPVVVPSYPDGPRPSSITRLRGGGLTGCGEHVGWSDDAHRAWAARLATLPLAGQTTVAAVARLAADALAEPYDRAALEAAAIDLALRQAGSNPFRLVGAPPAPLRYVVSFERTADPASRAARELEAQPSLELKVDADPAWDEATLGALAALDRVRVLDFKLAGRPDEHERAHRALPSALIEDPLPGAVPWSASLRARLSLDGTITSAAALDAQPVRPVAVNVKPARIGSVLEALAVVATCAERGIAIYFGGMFEVAVGRAQVQTLAALLAPDAPNDVAPIACEGRVAPRPPRLDVFPADDGFGGC